MQSNPTQTLVSARTTTTARLGTAGPSVVPQHASLEERNHQRSRIAFEHSLERLSRSETEGSDAARTDSRTVDDDPETHEQDAHHQRREQDQENEGSADLQAMGRIQQSFLTANAAPQALPAAPMLSAEQLANLQRMAAAIAEVVKGGVDARMTIEFGMTGSVANAAILGRDRLGALTIHLTGMSTFASPAQLQSMRAELIDRLNRRKIAVSLIEFLDDGRAKSALQRGPNEQDQTPDRT